MPSTLFGEHLKREREMRGVSLAEISTATRIAPRYLEALEKEQWELLPGGVFNRGFIRSVAHFLGLDEDSLVAEYALATKDRVDVGVVADAPGGVHRNWLPLAAAIVLLLAILGAAGFLAVHFGTRLLARLRHKSHAELTSPLSNASRRDAGMSEYSLLAAPFPRTSLIPGRGGAD
ncbi:MAG: helix-turn-helix domain-containing protein [Candidatus Acidiferrales bacterium]